MSLPSPTIPRIRPTHIEVDLDAVVANAGVLSRATATPLYAVVKADAYGHGAAEVAGALMARQAVAGFAVSLVEEGAQLRDAGVTLPILVMGPALDGGHDELAGRDMTAMVTDEHDLEVLAEIGRRRGLPVELHVKVDTGMGRLGFALADLQRVITRLVRRGGAVIHGLATHLASADSDDPGDPSCQTRGQLAVFADAIAIARAAGAAPRVLHTANSSGAFLFPEARYDLARCGLALYGNGAGRWREHVPAAAELRQAMRLVSQIVQLRTIPEGGSVGYGALWRAATATRVAVLPLGYADGLARRLTGTGEALIRGQRCPLIGAISMDVTIADVSALPDAAVGDEAVLLGAQGGDCIRTAELASRAGLTEYEITCGVSKRVPRVHRRVPQ